MEILNQIATVIVEVFNRIVTALVDLHPWHAMVVHYPIALSTVGLLFILLALWRRSEGNATYGRR